MATKRINKQRARAGSIKDQLERIETDPAHHLTGPFQTQTPFGGTPIGSPPRSPTIRKPQEEGFWSDIKSLRWVVRPASSFKIIAAVVALYINWEIITPHVAPGSPNPFTPLIFISHPIESSSTQDPRYAKSYLDLVFIASYVVVFSFLRQIFILHVFRPFARWYGIKRSKLDRFGEQGYAIVYWGAMSVWGYLIMEQLPTYWYNTKPFWIGYPHWQMKPQLKMYYLMQASFWTQQLLVLVLGLEKPRKDYYELVCHHFVTIWLIGWSYLVSMTLMGNAVFLSMDFPDTILAFSKLLNYMQREVAKTVVFAGLIVVWTYFRIYLNSNMLWSVWFEFDMIPAETMQWAPEKGVWLAWWIRYQIFIPLLLLLCLNIFWYFLILRIAYRAVFTGNPDDDRSDDEDDDEGAKKN